MPVPIRCSECAHYFVTHEPRFPHGCRAFGTKSRALPSDVVRLASGTDCTAFGKRASAPRLSPLSSPPLSTVPPPRPPRQAGAAQPASHTMSTTDTALDSIRAYIEKKKIDRSKKSWRTSLPEPPKATFDKGRQYFWDLETSEGPLRVKLLHEVAPKHVASTIYLTELGFYDELTFHRVITGFMAQGGCPLGSGTGGPGYKYAGEFDKSVKHDRPGLLSMANAGPNTDGSQFFLTFVETSWLDGKHTIFGEVENGAETLQALEAQGSPSGATRKPLSIRRATIAVE